MTLRPSIPATTPTPTSVPRLDLYAPIHKALRAWMFDTLVCLGRVDGRDPAALSAALRQVEALMAVCEGHILHEETFLHPVLEACRRDAAREADQAHNGHQRQVERMKAAIAGLRSTHGGPLLSGLTALYRELALFVAENLEHMHWEETVHNEVLWARHSDAELERVHDALVQSIPPQEMAEILRHMLPALSPIERIGMLADMRSKMPPGAFDGVLALAQSVLPAHDLAVLLHELGIQPTLPLRH